MSEQPEEGTPIDIEVEAYYDDSGFHWHLEARDKNVNIGVHVTNQEALDDALGLVHEMPDIFARSMDDFETILAREQKEGPPL